MSEHDVREVHSGIKAEETATPLIKLTYKQIKNPHKAQLYLDYGVDSTCMWLVVGVNDTEYTFGFQSKQQLRRGTQLKPKPPQDQKAPDGNIRPLASV